MLFIPNALVRLSDAVDSSALLSTRHVLVDVRRRNRTDPGLEARSQTGPHSSIRLHGVRVRVSIADCHSLDGSIHGRRSVESTVSVCVSEPSSSRMASRQENESSH